MIGDKGVGPLFYVTYCVQSEQDTCKNNIKKIPTMSFKKERFKLFKANNHSNIFFFYYVTRFKDITVLLY